MIVGCDRDTKEIKYIHTLHIFFSLSLSNYFAHLYDVHIIHLKSFILISSVQNSYNSSLLFFNVGGDSGTPWDTIFPFQLDSGQYITKWGKKVVLIPCAHML